MRTFQRSNRRQRRAGVAAAALLGLALTHIGAPAPVAQYAGPVTFESEIIRVAVRPGTLRVDGTYVFRNNATRPQTQGLVYPFPIDSLHSFPRVIAVESAGKAVPYRTAGNAIAFGVELPARGAGTARVVYEQACPTNSGCYILTSTSAWQRPLELAEFEITVGEECELEWMAYEADTAGVAAGKRVYGFRRTNFMPEKDLCMRWRVKE